jgi:hypothetical protein
MDAERRVDAVAHAAHDVRRQAGQRSTVGVAQHHPLGTCGRGGLERGQRVARVEPPAIEEVLGVVHDFSFLAPDPRDTLADHREIFLACGLQHPLDMQDRALPD